MNLIQEEMEYRWLDAAKSYEHKLHSRLDDASLTAECWDKIGFCYDLASRQAKDVEEFKRLRQQAVSAYETAAKLFGADPSQENQGKSAGCLAVAEYARSWLASTSSAKRKTLDNCWTLGKKALEAFRKSGDELCYGKICNTLSLCLFDRLYVAPTLEEKRKIAQEGIDNINEALSTLSKLESKDELAVAFSAASLQSWYFANICEEEEERKGLTSKCLDYSKKAMAVSGEAISPYSKAISLWAESLSDLYFTEKIEASLESAKEMLRQAEKINDNYFKGIAYYLLAHITDWAVDVEPNQDKKKQKYEEILKFAKNSVKYLQLVCQNSATAETYRFYTETYSYLAREFAVKPIQKLGFSKKAMKIGEKGLEYATRSGSPEALGSSLHAISKVYHYYSELESKTEKKKKLLKEALNYRKEYIATVGKAFTSNFWTLGVGLVYSGKIKADLADLEEQRENKAVLLEEAVSDLESGVAHCNSWIKLRAVPALMAIVAGFEDSCGNLLKESYSLTKDKAVLTKANEVYRDAAEKFKRVDLPSRVAESYWKIASNLDLSEDYQEAAENFENAFAGYKAAAKKIHQFSEFYLDYATYMKAWSEIQNAKLAHSSEKYHSAMQHYEKTSTLLSQSKLWSYLSSNFHAWGHLELAEDFSRKENSKEAVNSFKQAIRLFQESERTLRSQIDRIDKLDERNLVARLIEVSTTREEYGRGRIEIEEAKILDKQGDHAGSSEKYEAAAATFQKISQVDSEQTRKEVKPLVYLCQAWQKMTLAEAKSSPTLYREAAELFKLANQHTLNESSSLLALAHSSFCKALEFGTEFEINRNAVMYAETKKQMDAAATYYLKAGFESASEYAKATQRLFDAYVYMDNAKRETDPQKEAKYYLMAEKVLQISAEAYTQANHTEKTSQVQKLLKKVQEEKELALSLSEVLHAPTIASSTASFATMSPSEEKAVGLERFEHADIQAKLIQRSENIKVGEDLDMAIQIVNVGKEPVFLTKLENALPAGFQFVGKPDEYSFQNTDLIMKGNRLDPLKTEEIRFSFKPFRKVDAELKPRIICVDETGRQMLYDLEPKALNVSQTFLANRVTTGYEDLDSLLLGGIPEGYAVVLTSPSCDERELIVRRFLEAGARENQLTFYITMEPGIGKALAEENESCFRLFVCNPRADVMVKDLPNICRLKGVESLTEIDIALATSFRKLAASPSGPRRACIEIVSDVLLQHHAVNARKWIGGLLPELRSKGFTTLAVLNPQMHPPEEVQAILGLFEGEIRISEKETATKGVERALRIRKLHNQKYLENELTLSKEELELQR